jgi:F-type H+-transporting ATPase subunit delta
MAAISRRKIAGHVASRLINGDASTAVLEELAAYLVNSRRTKEADLIIRDVEAKLAAMGTVLARITSARPLEAVARRAIEKYVAAQTDTKHIKIEESIDETLLGGVRIEFPGYQLDASVKAKLERLTVK